MTQGDPIKKWTTRNASKNLDNWTIDCQEWPFLIMFKNVTERWLLGMPEVYIKIYKHNSNQIYSVARAVNNMISATGKSILVHKNRKFVSMGEASIDSEEFTYLSKSHSTLHSDFFYS